MASRPMERIVEQIRALPPEEQVELAHIVDRLTWARRWRLVCERIAARVAAAPPVDEQHVDQLVRSVRAEKPLSERSSTRLF